MLQGMKLVLPGPFTDTTRPELRDDPVLSKGSLSLLDFAHPTSPFTGLSGLVPNIAHKEAASVMKIADSGFPTTIAIGPGFTGARGKAERTSKGGLHGIVSKNPGVVQNQDAGMKTLLDLDVRKYLYANRLHQFYISVWFRVTRSTAYGNGMNLEIGGGGNSMRMLHLRTGEGWSVNPPNVVEQRKGDFLSAGNNLANAGFTLADATTPAAPGNAGMYWGMPLYAYNNAVASWATMLPSYVLYRMYLEDLTVSGRTYSQVDAIDAKEYNRHVLSPGGRYSEDTFTDPATIP